MAATQQQQWPVLGPEERKLLLAALNSNKTVDSTAAQQPAQNIDTTTNGVNPAALDASVLDASAGLDFDDSTFPDFNADTSFDLGFDPNDTLNDFSQESSPDGESGEKRKSPDDDDDDEHGDIKRRDSEDSKQAKKPGRKPLTSEPTTKRKAQNRAAQRAFRERKEKHLKDLEQKVLDLEKASESANHENGLLRAQVDRLVEELKAYRRRISQGAGSGPSPVNASAPSSNFDFDFPRFGALPETYFPGAKGSSTGSSPAVSGPSPHSSSARPTPGSLGSAQQLNGGAPDAINNIFTDGFFDTIDRNQFGNNATNSTRTTSPEALFDFTSTGNRSTTTSQSRHMSQSNTSQSNSPSVSSMSQKDPSSSCCTSPESSTQSPNMQRDKEPQPQTVYRNGFIDDRSAPVNNTATDFNFDWLATQNGGQFDPVLFGDYRESQAAVVGEGDFSGGFFEESLPFPDYNDSFNFNMSTPQTVPAPIQSKPSLLDQVAASREGDDAEDAKKLHERCTQQKGDEQKAMMTAHKICGDFDIDSLCTELSAKARCTESGVAVPKQDVEAALWRLAGADEGMPRTVEAAKALMQRSQQANGGAKRALELGVHKLTESPSTNVCFSPKHELQHVGQEKSSMTLQLISSLGAAMSSSWFYVHPLNSHNERHRASSIEHRTYIPLIISPHPQKSSQKFAEHKLVWSTQPRDHAYAPAAMKLSNPSAVPVYTISGSSTARPLPEWLVRKRKRSLKTDPEYANRIELLQDFEFEEASQCVRVSEDGEWVVSTGTYKPQIHVHYLPHLSLSYARHTDALNQKFELLGSGYEKQLHLQGDRTLQFHTPGGCHYTTRIPRYGRDLVYDRRSAEALVPAVGVDADGMGEVYRLNLELGRFMKSYAVDVGGDDFTSSGGGALQGGIRTGAVNTAAVAEHSHGLCAFGTSIGTVEFWDPRARGRVGILAPSINASVLGDEAEQRTEITALEFAPQGLSIAAGDSNGIINLYDLRSPLPLLKKDQGYGFPIQTLTFLSTPSASSRMSSSSSDPKILSADKRIIKIWDQQTGAPWTSVEPAVDLHDVTWCRDSGMLLTANEGRQQHSFFIPQLGPAPKWCAFLDNLVEEMAEDADDPAAFTSAAGGRKAGEVYDNYKFVTLAQLKTLNLEHLIGRSGLLRPYMHGFFVAQQLYEEARLISNPEAWVEQRQKSIRAKIEKERESRIRGGKGKEAAKKVKVNRALAERLIERDEKNERRKAKRALKKAAEDDAGDTAEQAMDVDAAPEKQPDDDDNDEPQGERSTLLTDPRFARLFEDEDFAVDESSYEFRALNPSTIPSRTAARGLTAAQEEALSDAAADSDSASASDSSSDDDDAAATSARRPRQRPAAPSKDTTFSTPAYRKAGHERQQKRGTGISATTRPRMAVSLAPMGAAARPANMRRDKSFGARVREGLREGGAGGEQRGGRRREGAPVVGEREVTFSVGRGGPKGRREGGASGRPNKFAANGGGGGEGERRGKRRSASNNAFRGL
ncbi:hypothetical protein FH972_023207 [Carpinus fangiana]|uniref:BZIP domain-containing protein n=1 Tax=Carpinus fangiana TaxID=176857 RepID=A0A5N6KUV5_9ROSI|nr:hypothetical protein FH972_023207 [Carpinus fangiana]